jgi:transposase
MTPEEITLVYKSGLDAVVELILRLEQENLLLKDKIDRLNRDSTTSHKPPSSDGFNKKTYPPKRGSSGRRPGGQKGHQGKARPIMPPEKINKTVPHQPDKCEKCNVPFNHENPTKSVEHHQVWELPKIDPIIEEHVFFETECTCGHRTRATVPQWVYSGLGENAQAAITYFTAVGKLTRRNLKLVFEQFFHFPISIGSIQNRLENSSQILKAACDQLEKALADQKNLNIDETSYPLNGSLAWLWVFVTNYFAVFVIDQKRSSKVLKAVLGLDFAGIIICDRFSAYIKYQKDRFNGLIQFCWAHIIRDIKALRYTPDSLSQKPFALIARQHIGTVFRIWHAFKAGRIPREQLIDKTKLPIKKLKKLCQRNQQSSNENLRSFCTNLLKKWECLFVFLHHDGVEPTNNRAEQTVRPGVETRKISYCTRSKNGQLLRARLLTITQTCRIQKRNAYDFIRECIHGYRSTKTIPSLLPNNEDIEMEKVA